MKNRQRIIILAVAMTLSLWLLDVAIDTLLLQIGCSDKTTFAGASVKEFYMNQNRVQRHKTHTPH